MNIKQIAFGFLTIGLISCNSTGKQKNNSEKESYSDIKIVGAMKNVMWKGELDGTINVEKRFDVSAPFFVYGNITEWDEVELASNIKTIQDLEKLVDEKTTEFKRPFAFKLIGRVSKAIIHIQNLPEGTKVSSPDEAHQGQISYNIENEDAEIIGFYSTEHKGIFTHHDSFLHMHLMTKDETKMGHLDELEIGEMKLYLPKK